MATIRENLCQITELLESLSAIQATPIIGILCTDVSAKIYQTYEKHNIKSYINTSYVKFIEGAGGCVAPIWIGRDETYYRNIMSKINGILIPGGAVYINPSEQEKLQIKLPNKCIESSSYIFKIAKEMNDANRYFPLWCTCLGFQLVIFHSSNENYANWPIDDNNDTTIIRDPRIQCTYMDYARTLKFAQGFRNSKLFAKLDDNLENIMKTEKIAYHRHKFCITQELMKKLKIEDEWKILATNTDENNLEFITMVEHERYPMYGCQFHPEYIVYELSNPDDTSSRIVNATQYFAKFFINECRRSQNCFSTIRDTERHLIKNFKVELVDKNNNTHCYLFDEKADYPDN